MGAPPSVHTRFLTNFGGETPLNSSINGRSVSETLVPAAGGGTAEPLVSVPGEEQQCPGAALGDAPGLPFQQPFCKSAPKWKINLGTEGTFKFLIPWWVYKYILMISNCSNKRNREKAKLWQILRGRTCGKTSQKTPSLSNREPDAQSFRTQI